MTEKKRKPGRPSGSGNKKKKTSGSEHSLQKEIAAIIILALGVFLAIALHTGVAGVVGEAISGFLKGMFGFAVFFLPYILIIFALLTLTGKIPPLGIKTATLVLVFYLMVDLINSARYVEKMQYGIFGVGEVFKQGGDLVNGGVFGMYAGSGLYKLVGIPGLYILAIVVALICLVCLFKASVVKILGNWKKSRAENRNKRAEEKRKKREAKKERKEAGNINPPSPTLDTRQESQEEVSQMTMAGLTGKKPVPLMESFVFGKESRPNKIRPKLNTKAWKKLPENKKKILHMVQDDTIFDERVGGDGYGLDGTEPSRIAQRQPLLGEEESLTDSIMPGNAAKDPEEENREFEGFIKREVVTHEDDREERLKTGEGPAIGGESIATVKSETEQENAEVAVSPVKKSSYKKPPLDLLRMPDKISERPESREKISERADLLETTLRSFGVDATVVNVISGPAVTRYEIEPARGVKVQSITRLADDIALNMRARSIRIEAPIPGKAAVGIEIENKTRQSVCLREIIGSKAFREHKSKLAFTVGRDIGGNAVVADLGKMPHMLIAGATGSGKSVCINTIIASILYKARPEEVKLVMIDPKMVELGNYNGIPHLLIPVVTDSTKAAAALQWAVAEMGERYKKFASKEVKNIGTYNDLMKKAGNKEEILPQIVIIIDELADLMMVASSQVEDAICRLAQLARAAGMHLVLATQRPSVDVITGLIKANIPSRIAFMVSSQIDSRTIIDMPGAEKLVGNGDMLFKPQDLNKPKRIQGAFISDDEVERLISFIKDQVEEPDYNENVMESIEKTTGPDGDEEEDELLPHAIETVIAAGQASTSMIQRRFRVGYNRAARIVEMMESRGIIGPQDGSRSRQVLVTEQEWEKRQEKEST